MRISRDLLAAALNNFVISVPFGWAAKAAMLPGKTLHVALCLQQLAQLHKTKKVRFGHRAMERYGVSRDATYDALRRLEAAGLISVDRSPGLRPMVTLIQGKPPTPTSRTTVASRQT